MALLPSKSKKIQKVWEVASRIAEDFNAEVIAVEVAHTSMGPVLRVYIDKEGGVTIRDCELINTELSNELDKTLPDIFPSRYFLEVSSPGLDRPIQRVEDFKKFIGYKVRIITAKTPTDKRRRYTGILTKATNSTITLNINGQSFTIPYDRIEKANLVPEF